MKRILVLIASLLVLGSTPSWAQPTYFYGSVHPIHPAAGGGFCYASGVHSHPYGVDPNIGYLYRYINNYNYFVGNPYHFGYQGQAFPYYGHHPLPVAYGSTFCYLDGAHYHHFLPPVTYAGNFLVNNGYYYYNGAYPAWYHNYRPTYYRAAPTYHYLPTYRRFYSRYLTYWRTYARPARIQYIRHRPRIVYRYTKAPVRRYRLKRPAYRYPVRQVITRPRPSRPVYRRPAVRSSQVYRPSRVRRPTRAQPAHRQRRRGR